MTALYVLFGLASLGTFLSGIAAIAGLRNHGHIQKLDKSINGRMDQLITSTSQQAHSAGVIEGHAAGVIERNADTPT